MVEIKNISKSFDGNLVLDKISMKFTPGKTNLIIGQSGSGKTVLLKSLLGLVKIDSGEMFFNDKKYNEINDNENRTLRREMGMVFQGSALFDSMSVLENVMFPMKMLTDYSNSKIKSSAEEVIDRVNLINSNNKFPSELSGGMQKRVAIARAIVMKPKYLFCDEPNSGLDPVTAIVIDELIKEITDEYNMTTIVITHDMNSVLEIGENIMFIDSGENKWTGTKNEILDVKVKELHDFIYVSKFLQQMKRKR